MLINDDNVFLRHSKKARLTPKKRHTHTKTQHMSTKKKKITKSSQYVAAVNIERTVVTRLNHHHHQLQYIKHTQREIQHTIDDRDHDRPNQTKPTYVILFFFGVSLFF